MLQDPCEGNSRKDENGLTLRFCNRCLNGNYIGCYCIAPYLYIEAVEAFSKGLEVGLQSGVDIGSLSTLAFLEEKERGSKYNMVHLPTLILELKENLDKIGDTE